MKKIILLTILVSFMLTTCILAQSTMVVDSSFGTNGRINIAMGFDPGTSSLGKKFIHRYSDGRMLLFSSSKINANNSDRLYCVARVSASGTPDPGFGEAGVVQYNGNLIGDPFSFQGWTLDPVAISVDVQGSIYLFGTKTNFLNEIFMMKLKTNGNLDSTFGDKGKLLLNISPINSNCEAKSMKIAADGKVLVLARVNVTTGNPGVEFGVARLLPNGTLDPTFGIDGKVFITDPATPDFPEKLEFQPDGKLIVGGTTSISAVSKLKMVRLQPNGKIDSTFGTNGITVVERGNQSMIQFRDVQIYPDGKILIAGNFTVNAANPRGTVVRLTANGSLDNSFGTNGISDYILFTNVQKAFILPNGNHYFVSNYNAGTTTPMAILKANNAGSNFPGFGNENGLALLGTSQPTPVNLSGVLLENNRLFIVGSHTSGGQAFFSMVAIKEILLNSKEANIEKQERDIIAYPNPFTNHIFLQSESGEPIHWELMDLHGRVLKTGKNNPEEAVPLADVPTGIFRFRFGKEGQKSSTTTLLKTYH